MIRALKLVDFSSISAGALPSGGRDRRERHPSMLRAAAGRGNPAVADRRQRTGIARRAGVVCWLGFQGITEWTVMQIVDHVIIGLVVSVIDDGWKRLPMMIAPRVSLRWRVGLSRRVVLRPSLSRPTLRGRSHIRDDNERMVDFSVYRSPFH